MEPERALPPSCPRSGEGLCHCPSPPAMAAERHLRLEQGPAPPQGLRGSPHTAGTRPRENYSGAAHSQPLSPTLRKRRLGPGTGHPTLLGHLWCAQHVKTHRTPCLPGQVLWNQPSNSPKRSQWAGRPRLLRVCAQEHRKHGIHVRPLTTQMPIS